MVTVESVLFRTLMLYFASGGTVRRRWMEVVERECIGRL